MLKDKKIQLGEIELELIIDGDNSGKIGNYVSIDTNGFQWLNLRELKRLSKALILLISILEHEKFKKKVKDGKEIEEIKI